MPHQYRQESLLLGAGTPHQWREGPLHEVISSFTCMTMEKTWRWDRQPTSALAALLHELKGGTTTTGNLSRINAALVYCGQVPRQNRRDDMSDPLEGICKSYLQEVTEYRDQN